MEHKLKHLEMIQNIISRMANNSFLIRGWSITIIAALFALASKDAEPFFISLAYFPALAFWSLDGYYLYQEKLFRALYDEVRLKNVKDIDFSMETSNQKNYSWIKAMFLSTVLIFHGVIIGSIIIVMIVFRATIH